MANSGPTSVLLHTLSAVQLVLSLGLTCVSIWFYVEVIGITSLRNPNHYLLDYNVYWPQVMPWVFVIVGLLSLGVSCCGFAGAKKKSKGFLYLYVTFQLISILLLIVAMAIALALADSSSTEKFIKDSIWDAFTNIETDPTLQEPFGSIEKRLQCCGAGSPRDYKARRNAFPISCCDTYYHGWIGSYNIDCDFTNKLANERHGCSEVVSQYTKIMIRALSGVCAFMVLISIVGVCVAVFVTKNMRKQRPKVMVAQYESESKKVLL